MGSVNELSGSVCLVTGGLGFIGSNVARALVVAGAETRVIDAMVPQHGGDRRNLDGVADLVLVRETGIDDDSAVTALLDGVDVVFNIAGQVSHHESMTDPARDLDLNVRNQLAFLETVRRVRPEAVVVHTSTRQVYGRPRYLPVDEEHPAVPRDINGVNKLAGEFYHRLYGTVHGVRTVALRLTNVYGPRQCLRRDGLGFLPVFVRRVLRGEVLDVFGDGSQRRDCLHVDDVVEVLAAAALRARSGEIHPGDFFNLGHSESLSLLEIAEVMCELADSGSSSRSVPWPEGLDLIDIGDFTGDYTKASGALRWQPTIGFREGMRKTLDFYRESPWYL